MAAVAPDLGHSMDNNRKRVLLTGTLVTSDGNRQVRIHGISAEGAHVSTDVPVRTGSEVFLKKLPIWAAAWVAWVEEKSAGLKFYRELSEDELAAIFHRE